MRHFVLMGEENATLSRIESQRSKVGKVDGPVKSGRSKHRFCLDINNFEKMNVVNSISLKKLVKTVNP